MGLRKGDISLRTTRILFASLLGSLLGAAVPVVAAATTVTVVVPSPATGTVQITASAKGGNVSRLDISIDGMTATTCNARQCAVAWNTAVVSNGQHTVGAKAVLRGGQTVSSERAVTVANYVNVSSPTTAPTPTADVALTALSLGASALSAGSSTPLAVSVNNRGTATAESVAVTVSLAAGGTTWPIADLNVGMLAGGASGTVATTLAAPLSPGTYIVVATARTATAEASTANNTTTASLAVTSPTTSTVVSSPPPPRNCDYYASPTGAGDGLSPSTPFRIVDFWSVAAAGRTLCLLDGVYRGVVAMIDPPDYLGGIAGKPITVRALNDGRVLIDGQSVRRPVFLNFNDYFVLEGFNAANSNESVVRIVRSKNDIVRRVAAWDAHDGNTEVIGTSDSDNILFEDVAAWGIARKTYSASQGGNNVTCRRCFGRWEGSHVVGPKMTFGFAYNNYNMTIENSIGTWSGERMKQQYTLLDYFGNPWTGSTAGTYTNFEVEQPYGIYAVDRLDGDKNANSRILGSIAYVTGRDRFNAAQLLFSTNVNAMEIAHTLAYVQPATHAAKGFSLHGVSGVVAPELTARSLTAIAATASFISQAWNVADVQLGTTLLATASPFVGSAGAQICTRYTDGVLTSEPLWPWPMNQRIIDGMVQSGRNALDVTATIEELLGPIPSPCRK
jgi:hypothetical protein